MPTLMFACHGRLLMACTGRKKVDEVSIYKELYLVPAIGTMLWNNDQSMTLT